jgi:hypothetical protein
VLQPLLSVVLVVTEGLSDNPVIIDWTGARIRPYGHPHESLPGWLLPRLEDALPLSLYCYCKQAIVYTV